MKNILGIALGAGILLSACGSNGSPAADQKEVKFGEIMNKGKQISYKVYADDNGTLSKNSELGYIIVTNNGKATSYNIKDKTLKDLKDKSNNEIIDIAKKQDKESFEADKENYIQSAKENIKSRQKDVEEFSDEIGEGGVADSEKAQIPRVSKEIKDMEKINYKEPKARKLKIKAVEDGTGNETEEERFYLVPPYFSEENYEGKEGGLTYKFKNNKNIYLGYNTGAKTKKIYNQNYAYLSDTTDDLEDADFLVTPVSKKTEFSKLDKPDSKYVKAVDE